MGYSRCNWAFITKSLAEVGFQWRGAQVLELGNGRIREDVLPEINRGTPGFQTDKDPGYPLKDYVPKLGAVHVSLDINGKDGAEPFDLSRGDTWINLLNRFDLVLNPGTSEHVEPLTGQYHCFKHAHDMAKVGAIFCHLVPPVGSFVDHCRIHYTASFFERLAALNGYELLRIDAVPSLLPWAPPSNELQIGACLRKAVGRPFTEERDELLSHVRWSGP